jgi:hypothetical protein
MRGSNFVRKFFAKAFAFLLGAILILNLSGTLADRVAPLEDWRIEHQGRLEHLRARQNVIEAVTLGNSHSDSLAYSVLGIEGQSLAFAAADLFEIEKYATLLDHGLPRLKTVFIAISDYSFRWDNGAIEPYRTQRRIRFYSMVPVWSPIHGDVSDFLLGRMESYTHLMSVMRSDYWLGVWVGLTSNGTSATSEYDGVLTSSVWGMCPHYTAEQLDAHALRTARRNVSDSDRMASAHPRLEQDAYDALARTIQELQSKGIRVILFTPTYYEKYTEYFMQDGSSIVADMKGMIQKLHKTYQVEYYDFSNDQEIMSHPELFYNSDHLGDCGKKIFTKKLLQAMNGNAQQ